MLPADKARYLGWPHPEERVPTPTMPLLGRVRVANRNAEAPGTSHGPLLKYLEQKEKMVARDIAPLRQLDLPKTN